MTQKEPTSAYTDAYQTGSIQRSKGSSGPVAFLLGLVIFLCGISTALGLMNIHLFRQLNAQPEETLSAVSFSDSGAELTRSSQQTALGLTGESISDFWHTYHDLPHGIFIQSVDETSDAAAKGIVPGDILVRIDGCDVTTLDELNEVLALCDGTVQLEIYRQSLGRTLTLTVEPLP